MFNKYFIYHLQLDIKQIKKANSGKNIVIG